MQNDVCINCGNIATQYHHVVPKVLGGNDTTNVVPLCDKCHGLIHSVSFENGSISHSELIKIGQQKSNKKAGRKVGNLDKMTDELKKDINDYVLNNFELKRFTNVEHLLTKHNISINTFKKYCRLKKTEIEIENNLGINI